MAEVARLPKDPGVSGWSAILPAVAPFPALDTATQADWLIIGAGFAGLAAARRLSLARPEDQIVILDAVAVGEGPAGRNSGFMIDLPHDLSSSDYGGGLEADRAQTEDNRMAIAFAAEMARAFALDPSVFAPTGKINGAATAKGQRHNRDHARHLAAMGEAYEMLDADAMQAITGSAYYRGGLRTPGTVMLQPAAYICGLARGLVSNRIQLHASSPVTALEHAGDWIATTPKGTVRAPRVILAVNGHLESFGHLSQHLIHVHTYASMTRRLTDAEAAHLGGRPEWGITPADPMGTTVRRFCDREGTRIVIRNHFTSDPTLEARPMNGIAAAHQKAFAARFPELGAVEMAHMWGGRLCLSRNNVQAIGEVAPGLYTACCQNGLGTAKGTLAGILAADLALGERSGALERALATGPARLPPKWLTSLGVSARLAYGKWTAGREI